MSKVTGPDALPFRWKLIGAASGGFGIVGSSFGHGMSVLVFQRTRQAAAGANSVNQTPPCTPGNPASDMVGTSGSEAWRECGMDDVLHKPFTVAKLGVILERFIAEHEQQAHGER